MSYMTFHAIWNQLLKKDSSLANPDAKVEFASENLKALLRQVYEQGEKAGKETGSAGRENMFDSLFGGRQ